MLATGQQGQSLHPLYYGGGLLEPEEQGPDGAEEEAEPAGDHH